MQSDSPQPDLKEKRIRRPNLCRHKGSGLGYVTWQGKELYFVDKDIKP